jgi:hypothetical protein
MPAQGVPAQGVPAQGAPAQGAPAQGAPAQGVPAQGVPASVALASVPEEGMVTQAPPAPPPCPAATCNECVWLNAAYRLSWFRQGPLNAPLVTTGSAASPAPGAIGQRDTVSLFGPGNLDFNIMQGIQVDGGFFLDNEHHWSLDGSGLYYIPGHIRSLTASDNAGNPVIARPAVNSANGQEISYVTALPGSLAGSTAIDARQELWGFELNGRYNVCCTPCLHTDFLLGYRQMYLREKLSIQDQLTPLVPNFLTFRGAFVNAPNSESDVDQFSTSNGFYGINLGTRFLWQYNWLSLALFGKAAVGVEDEKVHIQGQTSLITRTNVISTTGGILALASNIGNHSRSVFGVVPEGGITVGINVLKCLRVTAGYSFLMWSNVVRPGNEIDRLVNPGLVPSDQRFGTIVGGPNPQFTFKDQALWIHTLNFGVEMFY